MNHHQPMPLSVTTDASKAGNARGWYVCGGSGGFEVVRALGASGK
jgi:hypothetical protein